MGGTGGCCNFREHQTFRMPYDDDADSIALIRNLPKMLFDLKNLRRVLIWEIVGYFPPALSILESTNRVLCRNL